MSLPVWGEWIEIFMRLIKIAHYKSLPVWGEWIEMNSKVSSVSTVSVSPRVGRVD